MCRTDGGPVDGGWGWLTVEARSCVRVCLFVVSIHHRASHILGVYESCVLDIWCVRGSFPCSRTRADFDGHVCVVLCEYSYYI